MADGLHRHDVIKTPNLNRSNRRVRPYGKRLPGVNEYPIPQRFKLPPVKAAGTALARDEGLRVVRWLLNVSTPRPEAFAIRKPDRVSSRNRDNLPGHHI